MRVQNVQGFLTGKLETNLEHIKTLLDEIEMLFQDDEMDVELKMDLVDEKMTAIRLFKKRYEAESGLLRFVEEL